MPDDNVLDQSLVKLQEVNSEAKGFTKQISAARQEMERLGQESSRQLKNVAQDFKNMGSSVANNSMFKNVGHKLGGAFLPVQLAYSATPEGHASQMKDFYMMQAMGKGLKHTGGAAQSYSQRMVWSQAARAQGLVGSGTTTRQAALTGQRMITAGAGSKELATQAQALKMINVEAQAASKSLEALGRAGKTVGGFLDFGALRSYEFGLESLAKTGTRAGAALAKAFGPVKFLFSSKVGIPVILGMELDKAVDKAREVEQELTQRNKSIGKILGVPSTDAGAIVRQYAQTSGTTQFQAQESVGRLASMGFRSSEMESIGRQVEVASRRQGISRDEALLQRTGELQRGLVGLSGTARERAFREMSVQGGTLDSGPTIRALNPEITMERARRLWGNTPSIWKGLKERVAYDIAGTDPFQESIVTRAGRGLGRVAEDFSNATTYVDPLNATKQAMAKTWEGLGGIARTISRNRAASRAAQMDYSPRVAESYTPEQRAVVKQAAEENFYRIRRQEEEEKLAEAKSNTNKIKRAQEARKAYRERRQASLKIALARQKLRQAEATGNEALEKSAREEMGMAMRQASRSQKVLDTMNLGAEERALFEYATENEGGDIVLQGRRLAADALEKAQEKEAERMEEEEKKRQVSAGTRFGEAGEKAAMEKYASEYDLEKETAREQQSEKNILELSAEKEKYETLAGRATGEKEKKALDRKIEELTAAINKNAQVYREASQNVQKLLSTSLKSIDAKLQKDEISLMRQGSLVSSGTMEAKGLINEADKAQLKQMEEAGLNNPEIAKRYGQKLSQIQKRSQIRIQSIDNEFIRRERALDSTQMGYGAQMLEAQGLVTGDQGAEIQDLIDSGDPFKQHRAAKRMGLAQRKYQTMMAGIGVESYRIRKRADIDMAGRSVAAAERKGIDTIDIAPDLTSEVDLIRDKAKEILNIRKNAYEREVEFTRNYTRMRMDIIKTHYDNASQLEAAKVSGTDRAQAGALQYGREIYSLNQQQLGVFTSGFQYEDRSRMEARQARSLRESRLGAMGIQTPRAIQRLRGMRAQEEAEQDFARQRRRSKMVDIGRFEAAAGTLRSLDNFGYDREALMQSEGGLRLLQQTEQGMQGVYERAGYGDQSRQRQMDLINKQKVFAARRFVAGEKIKEYQTQSMDEQLSLAEKAVQESAAEGAGEGKGDARLRADYARKLGEAASLAGEQGRVEDMERLMQKQEKIMEALPEEYKKDFADVQAQMNKHLEVAEKELTAIKKHWDDFRNSQYGETKKGETGKTQAPPGAPVGKKVGGSSAIVGDKMQEGSSAPSGDRRLGSIVDLDKHRARFEKERERVEELYAAGPDTPGYQDSKFLDGEVPAWKRNEINEEYWANRVKEMTPKQKYLMGIGPKPTSTPEVSGKPSDFANDGADTPIKSKDSLEEAGKLFFGAAEKLSEAAEKGTKVDIKVDGPASASASSGGYGSYN